MSIFGPNLAQSVAGLGAAERTQASKLKQQETKRPKETRKPGQPDADEVVLNVQAVDAVRDLKENADEEANEDHQEHGQGAWYHADGKRQPDQKPKFDFEA